MVEGDGTQYQNSSVVGLVINTQIFDMSVSLWNVIWQTLVRQGLYLPTNYRSGKNLVKQGNFLYTVCLRDTATMSVQAVQTLTECCSLWALLLKKVILLILLDNFHYVLIALWASWPFIPTWHVGLDINTTLLTSMMYTIIFSAFNNILAVSIILNTSQHLPTPPAHPLGLLGIYVS